TCTCAVACACAHCPGRRRTLSVLIDPSRRPTLAHLNPQQVPENILMKRLVLMAAVAGTATLAACGGGDVIVQAYTAPEGGQPTPITNLPIRALPYDRDAIFDSLATAYG